MSDAPSDTAAVSAAPPTEANGGAAPAAPTDPNHRRFRSHEMDHKAVIDHSVASNDVNTVTETADANGNDNGEASGDSDWESRSDAPHIPGFSELTILFENRRSIVFRGIRTVTGQRCIIKLLNCEFPTALQLWLFEQQVGLPCVKRLRNALRGMFLKGFA